MNIILRLGFNQGDIASYSALMTQAEARLEEGNRQAAVALCRAYRGSASPSWWQAEFPLRCLARNRASLHRSELELEFDRIMLYESLE